MSSMELSQLVPLNLLVPREQAIGDGNAIAKR